MKMTQHNKKGGNKVKKFFLVALVSVIFITNAHAGVFNSADSIIDLVNKLEVKTGGFWLPEEDQYNLMGSASLYTFKANGYEEGLFRIGSVDLGYMDERKVFLATMIDSKILDTFNLDVPFIGSVDLMAGLAIGVDFNDGIRIGMDDIFWGIPTVGFKLQF